MLYSTFGPENSTVPFVGGVHEAVAVGLLFHLRQHSVRRRRQTCISGTLEIGVKGTSLKP